MSKTRVTISLDPDIEDWLRASSEATGKSLSQIVRLSLKEFSVLQPERFSRSDKARSVSESAWRKSSDE